jgi:LasA protease
LGALAARYGVEAGQITSPDIIPKSGLIPPGQELVLPGNPDQWPHAQPSMPDSEVVYSPSALGFSVAEYLKQAGGSLASQREYLRSTGWTSAADVISRVALEYSINPRLLLSLLDYECGCVRGQLRAGIDPDFLLGVPGYQNKGLYRQMEWAATRLSLGYYSWRAGEISGLQSLDNMMSRPAPALNAGSVALETYFASKYAGMPDGKQRWETALDQERGLPALHRELFGDPWERARNVEPLLPAGLAQPSLSLPFEPGRLWSFSSGPHPAWGEAGALAALDFAPAVEISGCVQTDAWVVAVADGLVVRSAFGVVVQDIYQVGSQAETPIDGAEQTGWAVMYLHVEERQRVAQGTFLHAGERIGHPSCEGGRANGTHVHLARKYNGEWILADGAIPFVLSGWTAHAGAIPYQGTLTKDDLTVVAHPYGSFETHIMISNDEP